MMIDVHARLLALRLIVAAGLVVLLAASPAAASNSPWNEGNHSRIRLIAAPIYDVSGQMVVYAGVQIEMDKGWKTYWRSPGESGGIPPLFDWSGSTNLAEAEVLYPGPRRLKDAYGYAIGYKDGVVFPVRLRATNPDRPIALSLKIQYGVCLDICIPAEAELDLEVPPGGGSFAEGAGALVSALDRVPRTPGDGRPRIVGKSALLSGPTPHLEVAVRPGADGGEVDLFVEEEEGLFLPVPEPLPASEQGVRRFRIDLTKSEGAGLFPGRRLRLTMVGPGGASSEQWQLPAD